MRREAAFLRSGGDDEALIIDRRSGGSTFQSLWEYRELLWFLVWRDVSIRYKQAVLGVGWAVIQPLMTMVVFTVVFGRLAQLPSDGLPYPVFTFAALLPWQLFAGALQRAGTSVVGSANLVTKVYFPRLLIPASSVLSGLVDYGISLLVLFGMVAWYRIPLTPAVVAILPLTLLTLLTALSVGVWFAALNVEYRDVGHIVPFIVQLWMYASPVAYSANMIPEGALRVVYGLNPMAGVIQGFRWALLGAAPPSDLLWVAALVVLVIGVSGVAYFRKMERTFADVI